MKRIHGLSRTPVGVSWKAMLHRCYDTNHPHWFRYGGRGIVVCEFLRASPVNLRILLGDRGKTLTLERIDNDNSYTCGNCAECLAHGWNRNVKWATVKEQARNRRSNVLAEFGGCYKTLAEWAEVKGINQATLKARWRRGLRGLDLLKPSRKYSQ